MIADIVLNNDNRLIANVNGKILNYFKNTGKLYIQQQKPKDTVYISSQDTMQQIRYNESVRSLRNTYKNMSYKGGCLK